MKKKNVLCPNFPDNSRRLLTTRLPFVAVIKRSTRWHRTTKSPHLLEPLGETLQTGSAPNWDKSASVNLSSHYTHLMCLLSTYYIPSHHGDYEGIESPLPKGAEGEVKHAVPPSSTHKNQSKTRCSKHCQDRTSCVIWSHQPSAALSHHSLLAAMSSFDSLYMSCSSLLPVWNNRPSLFNLADCHPSFLQI